MIVNEIGGYFGFELFGDKENNYPYNNGYHYKSARACFNAFLVKLKIEKIYFPKYICDSMLLPLIELGVKIKWYSINERFEPIIDDYDGSLIFYVNYFGICDKVVHYLISEFGTEKLIVDNSQSFYSFDKVNLVTSIYSPRKFFATPQGGTILTSSNLQYSGVSTTSSTSLMAQISRFEQNATAGYDYFRKASFEFNELNHDKMSKYALEYLNSLDYNLNKQKRIENFNALHKKFKLINGLNLDSDIAPLCYPLKFSFDVNNLRERLNFISIFNPKYWSDAEVRVSEYDFENQLINKVIYLPLDQRYSINDMRYIADKVFEEISNE